MATRKSQSATITLAMEEARKRRHIRRLQLARNKRRREATAAKRAAEKDKKNEGKVSSEWLGARGEGDSTDPRTPDRAPTKREEHNHHVTKEGELRPGLAIPAALQPSIDQQLDVAIRRAISSPGLAGEVNQLLQAKHLAGEIRRQEQRERERSIEKGEGRKVLAVGQVMREESGSTDSQLEILHHRLSVVHEQTIEVRARAQRATVRMYGRTDKDEPETSSRTDAAPGDGSLGNLFDILGRLESAVAGLSSDVTDLTKGF